jgi:hypothetical protein
MSLVSAASKSPLTDVAPIACGPSQVGLAPSFLRQVALIWATMPMASTNLCQARARAEPEAVARPQIPPRPNLDSNTHPPQCPRPLHAHSSPGGTHVWFWISVFPRFLLENHVNTASVESIKVPAWPHQEASDILLVPPSYVFLLAFPLLLAVQSPEPRVKNLQRRTNTQTSTQTGQLVLSIHISQTYIIFHPRFEYFSLLS